MSPQGTRVQRQVKSQRRVMATTNCQQSDTHPHVKTGRAARVILALLVAVPGRRDRARRDHRRP